jgi:hypothetical protein
MRDLATNTLKIYRNGTLDVSAADATGITNGIGNIEPLLIANAAGLASPFTGALDEIKMYNYALSPAEITALATLTLPVSLASFTAQQENNRVRLNWATFSEQNNNHFDVEKSIDGLSFTIIANLQGQGTTNNASNYVAYDSHPATGTNYYRLKQYDNDGSVKTLGLKAVKFGFENEEVLIYPNPVAQHITIKVPVNVTSATVTITSLDGKRIYSNNLTVQQNQSLLIDLENKPSSGVYLLEIKGNNFSKSAKIMVK